MIRVCEYHIDCQSLGDSVCCSKSLHDKQVEDARPLEDVSHKGEASLVCSAAKYDQMHP